MRRFVIVLAVVVLAFCIGCSAKDPTGYLAQTDNAVIGGKYSQAYIFAAHHSKGSLYNTANELIAKLGKKAACHELLEAKDMIWEEYLIYKASGRLNEVKASKKVHAMLNNLEMDYCL